MSPQRQRKPTVPSMPRFNPDDDDDNDDDDEIAYFTVR